MIIFIGLLGTVLGSLLIPLKLEGVEHVVGRKLSSSLINHSNVRVTQFYYTASIVLGTPGQEKTMRISTGTAISWVAGVLCNSCTYSLEFFNEYESSTAKKNSSSQVYYQYNSNSNVTGDYYNDRVSLGGQTAFSNFIVATSAKGFSKGKFAGILSLGVKNTKYGLPTFIDDLKTSGVINKRVFALYFNDLGYEAAYDLAGTYQSTLEIGGYNFKNYSDSTQGVVTVPIVSPYDSWIFKADSVEFDGTSFGSNVLFGISSLNFMQATSEDFKAIQKQLKSKGFNCLLNPDYFVYCICDSANDMPKFSMKIGEKTLEVQTDNLWVYSRRMCKLLILETSDSNWWLGASFLHEYYTVFDIDNKELSFAKAIQNNQKISYSNILRICTFIWWVLFYF